MAGSRKVIQKVQKHYLLVFALFYYLFLCCFFSINSALVPVNQEATIAVTDNVTS